MRKALMFFSMAALLASACAPYQKYATKIGVTAPSRGPSCVFRFENLDPVQAMDRYQHLGMITLTGATALSEEVKQDIRPDVCSMGGEIITLNAAAQMGVSDMLQINVYRERTEGDGSKSPFQVMAEAVAKANQAHGNPPQKPIPEGALVAVFDIQDESKQLGQDKLAQLTDYLSTRLAEVGRFRVIPSSQVRERIKQQQNDSYKDCVDQSCQIELGRALAAQKSFSTKLLNVGEQCALVSVLFDLKAEASESGASASSNCQETDLMRSIDELVGKFSGAKPPVGQASVQPVAQAAPAAVILAPASGNCTCSAADLTRLENRIRELERSQNGEKTDSQLIKDLQNEADNGWQLRLQATRLLGERKSTQAIPALQGLLDAPGASSALRREARAALDLIQR